MNRTFTISFSPRDVTLPSQESQRGANVVVLGSDTAEELFGNDPAVGKEVQISGDVFTVVGVFAPQKQVFGGGKNPER